MSSIPAAFLFDMCRSASFMSDSNTSGSSSYTVSMKVSFTLGSLLYSPSVYCCHLSFTSLSSATTFPGLDFMAPHLALRDLVMCLISLKRSLVLPILLLSSICLHFCCMLIYLPFLALLWKAAFNILYFLSSPLFLAFLRSSAIFIASSDSHFVTFFLLAFGTYLSAVSFTISLMSFHSSSGSLSTS